MTPRSLGDWLTLQQSVHLRSIDMTLGRVAEVARRLGLDRPGFPCITVAGTNGKGSTVAHLASMLGTAGHRAGAYSSPHLVRYNERVIVDGIEVADATLVAAFEKIEAARGDVTLTFFEYGTLAALEVFRAARVDVAVLEVGLGGRLDAVNLVDADVAVLCSVGFDHRDWLGDTLDAIGHEKAGVFRGGHPAVLATPDLPQSVYAHAQSIGAQLLVAGRDYRYEVGADGTWRYIGLAHACERLPRPNLAGAMQYRNAAAALAALEALAARVPQLAAPDCAAAGSALARVALPGRLQIVPREIEWLLDVAHNEEAARTLAASLATLPRRARTLAVLGMLGDKDVDAVVRALAPHVDEWILCTLPEDRGLDSQALQARSSAFGPHVLHAPGVAAGMQLASERARPGDRVLVCGSFHTVGPALEWLQL